MVPLTLVDNKVGQINVYETSHHKRWIK